MWSRSKSHNHMGDIDMLVNYMLVDNNSLNKNMRFVCLMLFKKVMVHQIVPILVESSRGFILFLGISLFALNPDSLTIYLNIALALTRTSGHIPPTLTKLTKGL